MIKCRVNAMWEPHPLLSGAGKPYPGTVWLSGYMFFPVAPVAGDHIETTPGQTLQVEGRELKLDGRIELYVGALDGWTRESAIAEFEKLPGYVMTTTA